MSTFKGPTAYEEEASGEERRARELGVCTKIVLRDTERGWQRPTACGKHLEPGKQWCRRHQFGI